MTLEIKHYSDSDSKDGTTYCGHKYKIRMFPEMRPFLLFTGILEQVTCKKCQRKLKEEAIITKRLEEYYKKIEKELESDDNHQIGYFEAVSNLLGNFNNGRCADCGFCYETEGWDFESSQPEAILHCRLDRCWIEEVKEIIRGTKHGKT